MNITELNIPSYDRMCRPGKNQFGGGKVVTCATETELSERERRGGRREHGRRDRSECATPHKLSVNV